MSIYRFFFTAAMLVVYLFMNNAQAATEWAPLDTVQRYYPQTNTYIKMDGAMINPAGCASTSYYGIESTSPYHDEFRRVLLTALASGKKVRVQLHSDPGDCVSIYPVIHKLYIER